MRISDILFKIFSVLFLTGALLLGYMLGIGGGIGGTGS
jgi:hypothetical protein